MSRIIELFPDWASEGVFKRLGVLYGDTLPWARDDGETLDIEYMLSRSGNKISSVFLDRLTQGGVINSSGLDVIVRTLYTHFSIKWDKLYNITKAEYDPIENYSMVEKETPNITHTRKTSVDNEVTQEGANNSYVYAFNSSNPSPQGKNDNNITTKSKADGDKNVITDMETGERELTRSGNIGVTTSQQMIQSEIDLWKWNFYESVFDDVDKVLTINYYRR